MFINCIAIIIRNTRFELFWFVLIYYELFLFGLACFGMIAVDFDAVVRNWLVSFSLLVKWIHALRFAETFGFILFYLVVFCFMWFNMLFRRPI